MLTRLLILFFAVNLFSCDSGEENPKLNNSAVIAVGVGQSNMSSIFESAVFESVPNTGNLFWERYSFSGAPIVTWSENNHDGKNVNYMAHFVNPIKSLIAKAQANGVDEKNIKIVVFWNQGEADCINGTDQATYRIRLEQIFNRLQTDFNISGIVLCLPDVDETNPNLPSGYTDAKMQPVRAAILDYAGTSNKIVTADLNTSIVVRPPDGLHFSSSSLAALSAQLKAALNKLP